MYRHPSIMHSGVMAEKSMTPPPPASSKLPPPPADSTRPTHWCPDCGTSGMEDRCPTCGLLVGGEAAARFWQLHTQIADLSRQRDQALDELRHTRFAGAANPPPPPPVTAVSSPSWVSGFTLRDFLLALGVFSLVVAVVSFAVVSWDDMSTAGRVGLAVGVTGLVGGVAIALFRRDLRATAEAITVFWAALLVADVAAGRVLLVPDAPPYAAWAVGLAAVAALLIGFGSLTSSRTAPALGLVAAAIPLPLLAMGQGSEVLVAASGLFAFAAAWWSAGLLEQRSGRFGTFVAEGMQHLAWSFAAGAVLIGLAGNDIAGAVALVAFTGALVAGALRVEPGESHLRPRAWMAKSALLVIAAPAVLTTRGDDDAWGLLAATATAALVLALTERSARRGRDSAAFVGAGTVILFGALPSVVIFIRSLVTLLEPATEHWTGSATETLRFSEPWRTSDQLVALGLLATVSLAAIGQVRSRPHLQWVAGAALGAVTLIAVPMVIGVPTWAAITLLIGAGIAGLAVAGATDRDELALAGTVLTPLGVAVSLATPTLTIGSLAVVSAAAWTLALRSTAPTPSSRAALFSATAIGTTSGLVLAITANAGGEAGAIALAVEIAAGALLLPLPAIAHLSAVADSRLGKLLSLPQTRGAYELSGAVVIVLALRAAIVTDNAGVITAALIIAAVLSVVHAVRPERSWMVVVASGLFAAAVPVQLDEAGVELVEAYAAPMVAVAAVFGWYVHRENPSSSSWITWGPATAIALGPSLAVALGEDAGVRPLVLPVVAFVVVAVGAMLRKQAPVIIGALVVAAVGIDFLITLAADLPRWIPFAFAGLLLLGLGANFEQSRQRAKEFTLRIEELA